MWMAASKKAFKEARGYMSYQDYVIRDGKFIGKFEEMYQDCDDTWYQSSMTETSYSRCNTINTIQRYKLSNVLEIGCGLG